MDQTKSSSSIDDAPTDVTVVDRTSQSSGAAPLVRRLAQRAKAANAKATQIVVTDDENIDVVETDLPPEGQPDVDLPHKGTIALGTTSYALMGDGSVETIAHARVWSHGDRPTTFEVGQIGDVATIDGIPAAHGINVIYGLADTGKTPILEYVANTLKATLIRAGEPFPGYLRSTAELAGAMIGAVTPAICIDSLKNVTGRLSGNATRGGLSREFFASLSDLSSFFAERQQAVFIVVNISSQQKEVVDETVQALESNSIGLWHVTSSGKIEWLVRTHAGRRRRKGTNHVTWAGDGVVRSLRSQNDTGSANPVNPQGERVVWVKGSVAVESPLNRSLERVLRDTNPRNVDL